MIWDKTARLLQLDWSERACRLQYPQLLARPIAHQRLIHIPRAISLDFFWIQAYSAKGESVLCNNCPKSQNMPYPKRNSFYHNHRHSFGMVDALFHRRIHLLCEIRLFFAKRLSLSKADRIENLYEYRIMPDFHQWALKEWGIVHCPLPLFWKYHLHYRKNQYWNDCSNQIAGAYSNPRRGVIYHRYDQSHWDWCLA